MEAREERRRQILERHLASKDMKAPYPKRVQKCSKSGATVLQQWSKSVPTEVQKWSKSDPTVIQQ
eukprot:8330733-Heterocapsa_arctica.AAC.1